MAWRADCPTGDLVWGAKVVDKETNMCARWIKEAIWIRKTKPTMNTDEGGLQTKSRVGQSARHAI